MDRKVILYIAVSLDGYIAGSDDSLEFLSLVEEKGEDYGYQDFIDTVDTVVMGRRTYDKVMSMGLGFPHADKESYIITRTPGPEAGPVKFFSGDLKVLIGRLKSGSGKHIFVDGGAEVVNELLQDALIDELIISVIPVLLGAGIRLFNDGRPEQKLELVSTKQFFKGLAQLHYKRVSR